MFNKPNNLVTNNDKVVICSLMKNEHDYLKQWIDHHLNMGIDEIYIFEDFTSKTHKNITDQYEKVHLKSISEILNQEDIRDQNRQVLTYQYFLDTHMGEKSDIGWCFFIDSDEYINMSGYDIKKFFKERINEIAICFYWRNHGWNGHIKKDTTKSLYELYEDDIINLDEGKIGKRKVAVNLNYDKSLRFLSVHAYPYMVNVDCDNSKKMSIDKYYIDHFYTKSWEDWIGRLQRGCMTNGVCDYDSFFENCPSALPYKEKLLKDINILDVPGIKYFNTNNYKYKKDTSFYITCVGDSKTICKDYKEYNDKYSLTDQFKDFSINIKIDTNYTHCLILRSGLWLPSSINECINRLCELHKNTIIAFIRGNLFNVPDNNCIFTSTGRRNSKGVNAEKTNYMEPLGFLVPTKYLDEIFEFKSFLSEHDICEYSDWIYRFKLNDYNGGFYIRYIVSHGLLMYFAHPSPFIDLFGDNNKSYCKKYEKEFKGVFTPRTFNQLHSGDNKFGKI